MRSRFALLAAAALLALAAFAFAASAYANSGTYVAMGDSYTSGPLIPNQGGSPLGCLRSDHNYPSLVAPSLTTAAFVDVSCSGATTDDFFDPQSVTLGTNGAQLNAINANTRVVTFGIGGNDIGFTSILESCINLNPFGTPCKNTYVSGGVDQLQQRIDATAAKIDNVIEGIHERTASDPAIFVVGYPDILPDTGGGCWPTIPIIPTDVAYLRQTERALNTMLATRAAADGAHYVDTYTSSIGHDACRGSSTRWVEPIIPGSSAAPAHPNATGMAHTAAVTLADINAAGY